MLLTLATCFQKRSNLLTHTSLHPPTPFKKRGTEWYIALSLDHTANLPWTQVLGWNIIPEKCSCFLKSKISFNYTDKILPCKWISPFPSSSTPFDHYRNYSIYRSEESGKDVLFYINHKWHNT